MKKFTKRLVNPLVKILNITLIVSMLLSSTGYLALANEVKKTNKIDYSKQEEDNLEVDGKLIKTLQDYKYNYGEGYDYREAFKESMVASQFCIPFITDLHNVAVSETGKEAFPHLTKSDGRIYPLTHRPLLTSKDCNARQATVEEILTPSADGSPRKFYIRYLEDVEKIVDEDSEGNETITYRPIFEYEEVYKSNPFTLLYYTMFSSSVGILENLQRYFTSPVTMDQYGNISLNSKSTGENHFAIVVPNYINPCITSGGKFPLNTRVQLSLYSPNILKGIDESKSSIELDDEILMKLLGGSIGSSQLAMYSFPNDIQNNLLKGSIKTRNEYNAPFKDRIPIPASLNLIKDNTVNPEYARFAEADQSEQYMYFAFGKSFKSNKILNVISSKKFNKAFPFVEDSGTYAIIPVSKLSSGVLDGEEGALKSIEVRSKRYNKSFRVYYIKSSSKGSNLSSSIKEAQGTSIFSGSLSSTLENIPKADYNVMSTISRPFINNSNFDKLEKIAFYTKRIFIHEQTGSSRDDAIEDLTPEEQSDQDVNIIVKLTKIFLQSPGKSLIKIGTSKKAQDYNAIMKGVKENYLFHIGEIQGDKNFQKILNNYLLAILLLNVLNTVFQVINLFRGGMFRVKGYIPNILKSIIMSTIPLIVLSLFILECDTFTNKLFGDTFTYWGALESEQKNIVSQQNNSPTNSWENAFRDLPNAVTIDDLATGGLEFRVISNDKEKETQLMSFTTLLDEANLKRGKAGESGADSIMVNGDKYSESLFYYFYDNFRYHFYKYYEDKIEEGLYDNSWESDKGLIYTTDLFNSMLSNPYFLYGKSYNPEEMGDFSKKSKVPNSVLRQLKVQDILSLGNLFSTSSVNGRPSYRSYINNSNWFESLYNSPRMKKNIGGGNRNGNMLDASTYDGGQIRADYEFIKDYNPSLLEFELGRINQRVVKRLETLQDYPYFSDETKLFMASVIATIEFNKSMNNNFKPENKLYPKGFVSGSYGMDTVFKSIFFEPSIMQGDPVMQSNLMVLIENDKGGSFVQSMVLACGYLSQFAGIITYLGVVLFFILTAIVCLLVYNLFKNFHNKAWVGLLILSQALVLAHITFLFFTNLCCVAPDAIIRTSIFGSYSPGIKIIILMVILLLKTMAICAILFFTFIHIKDLGGEIILDTINSVSSRIKGTFNHKGTIESKDNSEVTIEGNNVNINESSHNSKTDLENVFDSTVDLMGNNIVEEARMHGEKAAIKSSLSSDKGESTENNNETSIDKNKVDRRTVNYSSENNEETSMNINNQTTNNISDNRMENYNEAEEKSTKDISSQEIKNNSNEESSLELNKNNYVNNKNTEDKKETTNTLESISNLKPESTKNIFNTKNEINYDSGKVEYKQEIESMKKEEKIESKDLKESLKLTKKQADDLESTINRINNEEYFK